MLVGNGHEEKGMSKYELWVTQGQGPGESPDKEFDTLDEALEFSILHHYSASIGIKLPNGEWYDWNTYEPCGRHIKITESVFTNDYSMGKLNIIQNPLGVYITVKEK